MSFCAAVRTAATKGYRTAYCLCRFPSWFCIVEKRRELLPKALIIQYCVNQFTVQRTYINIATVSIYLHYAQHSAVLYCEAPLCGVLISLPVPIHGDNNYKLIVTKTSHGYFSQINSQSDDHRDHRDHRDHHDHHDHHDVLCPPLRDLAYSKAAIYKDAIGCLTSSYSKTQSPKRFKSYDREEGLA